MPRMLALTVAMSAAGIVLAEDAHPYIAMESRC